MQINRLPHGDGLTFTLEPSDFRLERWRGFIEQVKHLGAKYNSDTKVWSVSEETTAEFFELKREHFDSVIHKDQIALF